MALRVALLRSCAEVGASEARCRRGSAQREYNYEQIDDVAQRRASPSLAKLIAAIRRALAGCTSASASIKTSVARRLKRSAPPWF